MIRDPRDIFNIFGTIFFIWFLACLTMLGVGIFVVAHFIGKYW